MNTSRITDTQLAPRESFGLFAIIESKRVILPLKGVECDFSIVSGIGEVSMTQIFRQENDRALEHVLHLAAKHSQHNCKNLILITDAQIGNESSILELMKSARDFPVHCFGIDVALNDSLLTALCRQQGGTYKHSNPPGFKPASRHQTVPGVIAPALG